MSDDTEDMNGAETPSPFESGGLFVFDAEPILEWPVEIRYPVAGGKVRTVEIKMDLQYVPGAEFQQIYVRNSTTVAEHFGVEPDPDDAEAPYDPLAPLLRGWRPGFGRIGAEGAVPFNPENKRLVLRNALVRGALLNALAQMRVGPR